MVNPRYIRAYTLIELLTSIMILSLLLILVAPMYRKSMESDVNVLARKIASHLRYARSMSVTQARTVSVEVNLEKRELTVNNGKLKVTLPSEVGMKLLIDQSGMKSDKANVLFYPNGSSSGGVIELSNNVKRVSITTSWLYGGVTVQRM